MLDGVAYVGSLDGNLYAIDMATGHLAWPAPVVTAGPVSRAIAASNGVIYAGSGGAAATDPGTIAAYDASSGELLWTDPLEPGNTATPMVADGSVFVAGGLDTDGSPTHELSAFDAANGATKWPSPFSVPTGAILLPGAVADGQVFAESTDGSMYVVDAATGALIWSIPIGATLSPSGGLVDGNFYATSDDQAIHVIDIAGRSETGAITVKGTPTAPAILDGRIIVGTSLGKVVSIVGASAASGPGATP